MILHIISEFSIQNDSTIANNYFNLLSNYDKFDITLTMNHFDRKRIVNLTFLMGFFEIDLIKDFQTNFENEKYYSNIDKVNYPHTNDRKKLIREFIAECNKGTINTILYFGLANTVINQAVNRLNANEKKDEKNDYIVVSLPNNCERKDYNKLYIELKRSEKLKTIIILPFINVKFIKQYKIASVLFLVPPRTPSEFRWVMNDLRCHHDIPIIMLNNVETQLSILESCKTKIEMYDAMAEGLYMDTTRSLVSQDICLSQFFNENLKY